MGWDVDAGKILRESGKIGTFAFRQQICSYFSNMNWTQIAIADLDRIVKLVEQKETLQAQVAKINAELASFQPDEPAAPARDKPGRQPKVNLAAKGALKAAIIELLKGAGKPGLTVKEIAAQLEAKPGNIHVWFSSTGKRVKEINKVGSGRYAWVG